MPRAGETLKPQTLTPPSQVILASEAFREEAINRASGEAEAILHTAAATSKVGFGGLGGGGGARAKGGGGKGRGGQGGHPLRQSEMPSLTQRAVKAGMGVNEGGEWCSRSAPPSLSFPPSPLLGFQMVGLRLPPPPVPCLTTLPPRPPPSPQGIRMVAEALGGNGGMDAAGLRVAER